MCLAWTIVRLSGLSNSLGQNQFVLVKFECNMSNMSNVSNKPNMDPSSRICCRCKQAGATRWDAGQCTHTLKNGKLVRVEAVRYICEACDPKHKWFDIDETDF